MLAWVTLPQTEAYYAGISSGNGIFPTNIKGMAWDALNAVVAGGLVNFAEFDTDNNGYVDAIDIIHSGYGAESGVPTAIWSCATWAENGITYWTSPNNNANGVKVQVGNFHTEPALSGSSGTNIGRIGVFCHETGHILGLPDLYDTDHSSEGVGSWCLMANSWGFDSSQYYPPLPSAWCKVRLGWVTPTVLSVGGLYTAPQVVSNACVYKITKGYPANEYLLIENRQPVGFERDMPQGGLAIWHIDDNQSNNTNEGFVGQSGWPTNGRHYRVGLLQADGHYDMEKKQNRGDGGDLYHGRGVDLLAPNTVPNTDRYQDGIVASSSNTVSCVSVSGASMTFQYEDANDPVGLSAAALSSTEIAVSWTKSSPSDNVLVAWSTDNVFGTPVTTYTSGNLIAGGGQVLYSGSGTSVNHTGRTPNTRYYYKAWSMRAGPAYSGGAMRYAVTGLVLPVNEGFENGGLIPDRWTQEYVSADAADWAFLNGGELAGWGWPPLSAHSGSYNACLYYEDNSTDHKTRLLTPMIDTSGTTNVVLSFWHCMASYTYSSPNPNGQDELRVFGKTSAGAAWTLLSTYASSQYSWIQRTISLTNASSSYFIAFEGNAKYGCSVCVDDVSVTGTVVGKSSQTISAFTTPASALTTNTFTLSATATPSGLPVSYTVISGPGSLAGSTLSFTGAGSVKVEASQAGNGSYYAAPSLTNTITVTKATARVTLSNLSQTYNGSQKVVTATTEPASRPTAVTYAGSATAPTAAGSYAVTGAVTAADGLYQGSTNGTLVVGKGSQTISFANPGQQVVTNSVRLSATATSGLTVNFAVGVGSGIASIASGTNLTFTGTGTVSIVASQAGNANWSAASPEVTQSFLVVNTQAVAGAIVYVATNGNDAADGRSWAAAKRTIQAGVDAALAGETVLVSNGVYATGGRVTPGTGLSLSNRVVITNAITVRSVNGAGVTIISGAMNSLVATNGDFAVRCVYLASTYSVLSGFTLSNGHTRASSGHATYEHRGGALYSDSTLSVVSNCIVRDCTAFSYGGGAEGCTFYNCLFTRNRSGPGSFGSGGGGADSSALVNCTLVGNTGPDGGGATGGTRVNCIIYGNSGNSSTENVYLGSTTYSCTTPLPVSGSGNITADPKFVNAATGDFRLQAGSPCINTGTNANATGTADLDNRTRSIGGTVDMGAYEWQATTTTVTVAALGGGLATGGGTYLPGSNIVISATATNGHWFFAQWNDSNTSASRTITVPSSDITYTATFTQSLGTLTFYVATNGNDAADGHSWATAKRTIQGGVDATLDGDTVLVSNGVYATGVRVTPDLAASNRVVITKNITVQSVSGAAVTVIRGLNGGTYSLADSVRCVYMRAGTLSGFTLTNGCAPNSDYDDMGGGVICRTSSNGGSAGAGGTVRSCVITGCSASWGGGGATYGTLINCLVTGNTTPSSYGGAYAVNMVNCTVAGNTGNTCGGTFSGTLYNCIVYSNYPSASANYSSSSFFNSCTTPMPGGGTGNITANPRS